MQVEEQLGLSCIFGGSFAYWISCSAAGQEKLQVQTWMLFPLLCPCSADPRRLNGRWLQRHRLRAGGAGGSAGGGDLRN